jgi:16S rRNA U1498 N3-methylase RsmE
LLRAQDRASDGDRPWVLFVPLKKRHRTRAMIEKCTEIGAGRMMPIASDRMEGDASYDDDDGGDGGGGVVGDAMARLEDKLGLISIEASEQCERLDVPAIARDAALPARDDDGVSSSSSPSRGGGGGGGGMWTVRDFLPRWSRDWEEGGIRGVGGGGRESDGAAVGEEDAGSRRRVLLICRERGGSGPADDGGAVPVLQALRENVRVAFLVGPEGGWSTEEELFFDEICSGYSGGDGAAAPVRCVSLGPSVLRAETACMVAVAAWALTNDSRQQ